MTNDEILTGAVVDSWKLVIKRFDKMLGNFTDEHLQQQVAPGKNRVFYLLGHLTAFHDRMLPMLGLGERLHPELDDAYIANGDRVLGDPLSATELRRTWIEVNDKLTAAFDRLNLQDWLEKHAAVSDADFAENPERNRLSVVVSRTNHVSYHLGQVVLAKGA
jgi:DinB superfamily